MQGLTQLGGVLLQRYAQSSVLKRMLFELIAAELLASMAEEAATHIMWQLTMLTMTIVDNVTRV